MACLLFLFAGTAQPLDLPLWNGTSYNDAVPATGADKLHALGITGKGLTTAIIDSGFDLGHEIFKNVNIVNGYTYTDSDPDSDGEHGTHVAGIALSMAPDSNLWLEIVPKEWEEYSALPDTLVADKFQQVVDDAARYRIAALNISWGDALEGGYADPEEVAARNPLTAEAVRQLLENGVAIAAASGNAAMNDRMSFPDGLPGVVSVGAMDQFGYLSSLSTAYDKPGLFLLAPGASICSAYVPPDGYAAFPGTSMAAPHVTGAMTLLKSGARAASTEEITAALYDSAARVSYDPDEWIGGQYNPVALNPYAGGEYLNLLRQSGGDLAPYRAWLSSLFAKYDSNNVTAEEWRILDRIFTVADQIAYLFNDADSAYTTTDGETLYGDALFVKILEMTGGFTPLERSEYGFIQVDAAYRLLTSRRAALMAAAAAGAGSAHAGALAGFSGALGAQLDQNLTDLFQRLDGQPADVLARAARQLGPGRVADTLHSGMFGMLGLHSAAGRRLFAFRDRVLHRAEENEEEQAVAAEDALASLNLTLPSMTSVWGEGFGSYHDRDETVNSGGYNGSFSGLMAGMEKDFGEALAGGFAAWANHNIHGDGASRGNWGTFGLYGGLTRDNFAAGLSVAAGVGDYSLTRQVDGPAISLIGMDYAAMLFGAKGDAAAASFSAKATADWTLIDRDGWKFDAGVETTLAHAFMSGYTERTGGGLSLSVRRHGESYAEGGAGLRASKTFFRNEQPFLTASMKASALYGGAFGSDMSARFTGAGSSFTVKPERIKSAWFVPEASLSWRATERVTVSASYQGRFGRHTSANTGSLSVGLDW